MTQQRFDVIYQGEILDGGDIAEVKGNLARLFKTHAGAIEHLFSGRPVLIKRGLDRETALKYQIAMKKAGAACLIRDTMPADSSAGSSPGQAAGGLGSVSIAPPGTTLVAYEPPAPRVFDLSALSMAAPGADILEEGERKPAVPPPDPGGLSMDPPGVDLLEQPAPTPPPPTATGGMSVADVGVDLVENGPVEAAPVPDTSGITMAPAGADIVEEKELPPPPPVPDTGSLSLAANDDDEPAD